MSEPQHPQPFGDGQDADRRTSASPAQPSVQAVPDSLAAVGARLAQLREAKGWSIDDVSARLKVSTQKLRALEAGDVSHLPDATFALGVVRSYARMLGTDPGPLTQVLRREKGVAQPDLSMPASAGRDLPRGRVSLSLGGTPKRHSWLWGIALIVVAVLALAMWRTNSADSSAWFARLKAGASSVTGDQQAASSVSTASSEQGSATGMVQQGDTASGASVQTTQSQAAVPNGASAVPLPEPLQAEPAGASAVAAAPAVSTASADTQAAAATPASNAAPAASGATVAGPGQSIVHVAVTADSWFSVRQKDGKEVFSGIVQAGESKDIAGEPPFKVIIGNKAGLGSMALDGQAVDPSKYSAARGNVARFALP